MAAGRAAGALRLSSLVLLLDFISCQSLPRFGSVDGNVTLSPTSTADFTEVIWKKGKDKVIEWNEHLGIISYLPSKEKFHLDPKSGDLIILDLTPSDEDEYEMESVDLTNSSKFHLTVLDPLLSPTLHCTPTNESIYIDCEMPPGYRRHREQLLYGWHCPFPQCRGSPELGAPDPLKLHFTKGGDLSQEVHCFVENALSKRMSSMVLSTCVPGGNSRNRYTLIAVPFVGAIFVVGFLRYARRTERATPR